nr:synapse associated protein 1 [Hymenolepis microstoma]
MLSSLKSYIAAQLFTEEKDSEHSRADKNSSDDTSPGSAERSANNSNDSFVGSLKDFISFASESSAKIASELKSTAKHISKKIDISKPLVEFDRAYADFVAERNNVVPEEIAVSASVLYSAGENVDELDDESHKRQQRIKEEILRLSLDEQNFLRPPPHGSCFRWSPQVAALHMPLAMTLLNEDGNLSSMRFKLVPRRVKEDDFWRNYFYRISLIRQSENLTGEIHFPHASNDEYESKTNSTLSSDNTKVDIPKDDDMEQNQSPAMSSAAISLSSDDILTALLSEDVEVTGEIDEEIEKEILAELDGLEGNHEPIPP